MLKVKNHLFFSLLCFFINSLSFHYICTGEELTKSISDEQKGENKQEQVQTEMRPRISIQPAEYDVGEIYEGEEAVHTFTIANTGTAQLNISKVRAG